MQTTSHAITVGRLRQPTREAVVTRALDLGSRQAAHQWIQRALKFPFRQKHCSVQRLWAIASARAVRVSGEGMETCRAVFNFLDLAEPTEVEACMKAGRSCLLVVNGRVMPRLTTREGFAGNAELIHEARQHGIQLRTLCLDLGPMLTQIVDAVEHDAKCRKQKSKSH